MGTRESIQDLCALLVDRPPPDPALHLAAAQQAASVDVTTNTRLGQYLKFEKTSGTPFAPPPRKGFKEFPFSFIRRRRALKHK